jgi:cardiolipin synthase
MRVGSLRLVAAIAICLGIGQSSSTFGICASQPLFFTPASTAVPQVIAAIDSAKSSFHMIMYRISTQEIIDHLISAKNRGVDVQIILDASGVASEKPTGAFHQLSAAGVNVMRSSSLFSISHVKSFIVDNKSAYIMTLNLTTITPAVRDVGLITGDPTTLQFFNDLFATDVKNSANQTMDSPTNIPGNIVLAPGARDRLETLLKGAKSSIRLEVENFNDSAMLNDLIDAQKRGVKVQVLFPRCDLTANDFDMPVAQTLSAAGVEVYMMPAPMTADAPYIHQKSIVIDNNLGYLGSENFSGNSLDHARELGIIFTEKPRITQLSQMFDRDIGVSLDMSASTAYTCPASPFPPTSSVEDIE